MCISANEESNSLHRMLTRSAAKGTTEFEIYRKKFAFHMLEPDMTLLTDSFDPSNLTNSYQLFERCFLRM